MATKNVRNEKTLVETPPYPISSALSEKALSASYDAFIIANDILDNISTPPPPNNNKDNNIIIPPIQSVQPANPIVPTVSRSKRSYDSYMKLQREKLADGIVRVEVRPGLSESLKRKLDLFFFEAFLDNPDLFYLVDNDIVDEQPDTKKQKK